MHFHQKYMNPHLHKPFIPWMLPSFFFLSNIEFWRFDNCDSQQFSRVRGHRKRCFPLHLTLLPPWGGSSIITLHTCPEVLSDCLIYIYNAIFLKIKSYAVYSYLISACKLVSFLRAAQHSITHTCHSWIIGSLLMD